MRGSGIVLAGGTSRRMGVDKASLSLDGETLLARTVRVMSSVSDDVLVIGRPERDAIPGTRYAPDDLPDAGPLGGILTGLRRARYSHAAVVACDMPFLHAEIIGLLLRVAEGYDAAVPRLDGRAHPTLAVYSRGTIDEIERRLARGELALGSLVEELRVRWVDEGEIRQIDAGAMTFRNVNTPADWTEAQREATEHRTG